MMEVALAYTAVQALMMVGLARGRSAFRHYVLSPLVAAPLTALVAGGIALSSAVLAHWGFAHHGLLQWTLGTGLGAFLGYSGGKNIAADSTDGKSPQRGAFVADAPRPRSSK